MKFLFVVDQLRGYHLHWSFIWWNQHVFIERTTHRLLQSLDFNSCQENTQNWNWWNCVVQNYPTKNLLFSPCAPSLALDGTFFSGTPTQVSRHDFRILFTTLLLGIKKKKRTWRWIRNIFGQFFVCLFSSTFCLDKFHWKIYIYIFFEQTQYIDIAGIFDGHIFFHLG